MTDDSDDATGTDETTTSPPIQRDAIGEASIEVSAEERQRHIDHINEQLDAATCVEWARPAVGEQRIVLEHDPNPTFATLLDGLREDGWVPTEIDIADDQTTLLVEKDPNLGPRIALDDCPDCAEPAIKFGDRVEGPGLNSGKRIYCTACGAEWSVSYSVNNCQRGCCPFDREVVLKRVHTESQKIGPASDEYDHISLVRGLDPDAKIEFHKRTRPEEKVTVYDSPDEAPEMLVRTHAAVADSEQTASDADREAHWEDRLAALDEDD